MYPSRSDNEAIWRVSSLTAFSSWDLQGGWSRQDKTPQLSSPHPSSTTKPHGSDCSKHRSSQTMPSS